MKLIKILAALFTLLGLGFIAGPQKKYADIKTVSKVLPTVPSINDIQAFVDDRNHLQGTIKAGNESQIIWFDSLQQTEYAIVYLHGFSASAAEGAPTHKSIAHEFGMNLYLPLLAEHGKRDTNSFEALTPAALIASAEEALAIGKTLGKKVILMSCSTGGTLSAYLASQRKDIHALVMYSPNFKLAKDELSLITYPWGQKLLSFAAGGNYIMHDHYTDNISQYWNKKYHINGVIAVQSLVEQTVSNVNNKNINCPLLIACYYKNEAEQDQVVSVEAMKHFYQEVSTDNTLKTFLTFDANAHVICSDLKCDIVPEVIKHTSDFIQNKLHISTKD